MRQDMELLLTVKAVTWRMAYLAIPMYVQCSP
uniref:Uncharacterized protein n=1 Tax=Anguilla anguilla TaxID=7936 RepID=A0A0E9U2V4_ANGAN